MSFYQGLYKLTDLVQNIEIREENEDVTIGNYEVSSRNRQTNFNFIEIKQDAERSFSVFINSLNMIVNIERNIQKDQESSIRTFYKQELSKIIGTHIEFKIQKKEKIVIFSLKAYIPFLGEVKNSENILNPQIKILLDTQDRILLFLSNLFKK
jgi:hypothetical protein